MSESDHPDAVVLNGKSLTLEELARVARDPRVRVDCDEGALAHVDRGWKVIEDVVQEYKQDYPEYEAGRRPGLVLDYGITTGYGEFKTIPIPPFYLDEMSPNILRSHAAGLGETADELHPSNYFDPEVVRAALLIRLNAFLKGNSGVRRDLVLTIRDMLNCGIIPLVPIRGSVGSSGDLCPLSHLFVVLLGENSYFVVRELEDLPYQPRTLKPGLSLAEDLGYAEPALTPSHKEGLALTNGATFSAAILALAVHDASSTVEVADAACALGLEAVCGCARAFDPKVHEARGHAGQIESAARIRGLLTGSRLIERADEVQDVYSLRCAPAVHGAVRDAIAYARKVVTTEINSATDNPLFFPGYEREAWDQGFKANWKQRTGNESYNGEDRRSFSAGNFHGEPVGLAADFLGIAVAELANISERRTQMLLDSNHNRNLPANLIPHRGINSGFMIAQYSAAGVVSENKVLAHPASVDSIPTSSNSEDHNSMSTIAARKLRTILRNVQAVLAIELLVATQAVEWRVAMKREPKKPETIPRPTETSKENEREGPEELAKKEAEEFKTNTGPARQPGIAESLGAGTGKVYFWVRGLVKTMHKDRTLDGDIRKVRAEIEAGVLRPWHPDTP